MTKKGKRRLLSFGISMMIFFLTGDVVSWAIGQFSFFEENDEATVTCIAVSEPEPWVQDLSEQMGIDLDPALERHAALLARRDRLVVCPDTLRFTRTEAGCFRGSVERSPSDLSGRSLPEQPVYVYTGEYADGDYIAHVALLEDRGREKSEYDILECELIVQLQPQADFFPPGDHELTIRSAPTTTGRLFLPQAEPAIYLRAPRAGYWVGRTREKANLAVGSNIPVLIFGTASGGGTGRTDRIQYWSMPVYHDEGAGQHRIQQEIYLDGGLWASLSFWYPDGLYQ